MIRVERRERGVAWIIIDRPAARNAMTFAMWAALRDAARELDADTAVRVIVLTGVDASAFIAGTDIAEFQAFHGAPDGLAYEGRVDTMIETLDAIRVPTIAAIAGACTGGGVTVAATCDIRIGAPSVRIGVPIARTLGNVVSLRNVARVAELIGIDRVKALLLTGTLLDAGDAHRSGFLNEVVTSDDALHERARELAESIAGLAPLTLRASKEMARRLRAARELPDDKDLLALCYGSRDFREGLTAFLEKRRPRWAGE